MATQGVFKGGDKLKLILERIAAKANENKLVNVGFFEGSTESQSGLPTAFVAICNEYGSPSRGVPPRPFFRRMIQHGSPHWGIDLGAALVHYEMDSSKALEGMGHQMVAELQGSIQDRVYAPLKESTVARKGNDQTLIDSADMIQSVNFQVK